MENQNEIWLQSAQENLDQAIDEGNYQLCLDIIEDVFEKGFEPESRTMREQLRNSNLQLFAKVSPIQI